MDSKRPTVDGEEELHPEDATTKRLKRSQTEDLDKNLLEKPTKKVQTTLTRFLTSSNTTFPTSPSPTASPTVEEEQKKTAPERADTGATEVMLEETDSDVSYYSDGNDQATQSKRKVVGSYKNMPNVLFYLNRLQSRPQGDFIDVIHKQWKGDYKKLEIHHGYVQWIFPNFYGSAFNKDANRLTLEEARVFRENKEIAERLIKSYEMMLGFYGMKLSDRNTGKLERAPNYEERYKATLITSLHNHLRVRRILAHLNVVGFRLYAVELVDFLETEIYGEKGGYQKHLDEKRPLSIDYIRKMRQNPLNPIIKYDVFKEWKWYGEVKTDAEKVQLQKNCFTSDNEDYKPSILLRDE